MHALRSVLPGIGIQTDQCASPEIAHLRVVRQKYEAVIVDADSAESIEFMMNLRQLPQTKNTIIFGILEDMPVTVAFQAGANFVLDKPLTPERVHKNFRAAYGMIMRERRRYYRHPVNFIAYLEDEHNREAACVTNISEGGMALKIGFVLVPGLQVKWKFELPGSKQTVEGKGEVSWADVHGRMAEPTLDGGIGRYFSRSVERLEPAGRLEAIGKESRRGKIVLVFFVNRRFFPERLIAQNLRDQRGVHGVTGPVSDDAPEHATAEQR